MEGKGKIPPVGWKSGEGGAGILESLIILKRSKCYGIRASSFVDIWRLNNDCKNICQVERFMCDLVNMVNLCQRFLRETWTTPLATHSLFPIIYTLVYHDLIQPPEICPNTEQPLRYAYPHEVCWIVKHPQLVLQREIYISISIPYTPLTPPPPIWCFNWSPNHPGWTC